MLIRLEVTRSGLSMDEVSSVLASLASQVAHPQPILKPTFRYPEASGFIAIYLWAAERYGT
jgi:hypothetical protein